MPELRDNDFPVLVCSACDELVTTRQPYVVFPGDLVAHVRTYHTRRRYCRIRALDYQDRWVTEHPARERLLQVHEPYRGRPNPTQRRLLAMAARGELRCHLTRVQIAKPGDDLLDMMTNPDRPDATYHWYPRSLPRGADRYIPPLVEAGLLAEPIPDHLGFQVRCYTLTNEGWRTHRKYPDRARRHM